MATETISVDVFMNIPTPIIIDILARLPPNSLIRCRSVCKSWLNLISESEFVNHHLSESPTRLIVHKLYPRSPDSASFNLVEVEDETDHHGVRHIAGMNREISRSRKNTSMSIVGSIDGLICIHEHAIDVSDQYELIHVWNPIIREFITVQMPEGERKYPNVTTYGFGISSGKYLVVRIFQEIEMIDYSERIRDSICHVYTIGDGVWKSIGHAASYMYSCRRHGLFFNGNLHWFINNEDSSEQIRCLDLGKELFHPLPPPPEVCQQQRSTLNVYKGCLSVCNVTSDMNIVIWVMKEYGVQNLWSKAVMISKDLFDVVWNYYEVAPIIKVFKDGEILLLWRGDTLFLYDPKRKTVQRIDITESMINPFDSHVFDEIPTCIETTDYVPSIVSLKSLGEVNVYTS